MASTNPQVSAIGDLAVENAVDKYAALANLEGSRGSAARNALVNQGSTQAKAAYTSGLMKKLEDGSALTDEEVKALKSAGVNVDLAKKDFKKYRKDNSTWWERVFGGIGVEVNLIEDFKDYNPLSDPNKVATSLKDRLNPLATIQKYTSPTDVVTSLEEWQASQNIL